MIIQTIAHPHGATISLVTIILLLIGSLGHVKGLTDSPTTYDPLTISPTPDASSGTWSPTTNFPSTMIPSTDFPSTISPTPDASSGTWSPTTNFPSTMIPSTDFPSTISPTTDFPSTMIPTDFPSTISPTTYAPSGTWNPTTNFPSTMIPTDFPSTISPTTYAPSGTWSPTTNFPSTSTMIPTDFPSTISPTTYAPSGTWNPTTNFPSTMIPTDFPSTISPTTDFPSTMIPSTDFPSTMIPSTDFPSTMIPTTLDPSTMSPTDTPVTEVGIQASMILSEDGSQRRLVLSDNALGLTQQQIEEQIEGIICTESSAIRSCSVEVSDVITQSSGVLVEFTVWIGAILCTNTDCTDAQTAGNVIYSQVIGDLGEAIENGSLVSAFNDVLPNGSITASIDFCPSVIIPALDMIPKYNDWYPHWRGQSQTCRNDGEHPFYMSILGGYFEDSLDSCCQRYFSWDYFTCIGDSGILPSGTISGVCSGGYGTIPNGYYPNWGSSESKCLKSSAEMPSYFRDDPEKLLSSDIKECCENYYHWEKDICIEASGGDLVESATGKWYVNHQDERCMQDCAKESDGTCGGLANDWDLLYNTVTDCCHDQLSWIASSVCEARSTLTAVVGTSEWYVDWAKEKCVKDCEPSSSDDQCGGFAQNWDDLYKTLAACCQRLFYVGKKDFTEYCIE